MAITAAVFGVICYGMYKDWPAKIAAWVGTKMDAVEEFFAWRDVEAEALKEMEKPVVQEQAQDRAVPEQSTEEAATIEEITTVEETTIPEEANTNTAGLSGNETVESHDVDAIIALLGAMDLTTEPREETPLAAEPMPLPIVSPVDDVQMPASAVIPKPILAPAKWILPPKVPLGDVERVATPTSIEDLQAPALEVAPATLIPSPQVLLADVEPVSTPASIEELQAPASDTVSKSFFTPATFELPPTLPVGENQESQLSLPDRDPASYFAQESLVLRPSFTHVRLNAVRTFILPISDSIGE